MCLGVIFFAHGAQKVLGWWGGQGFSATMNGFTSAGIPTALAFLAIMAEFVGSAGLIFGFLTRIASLGIAIVMAVAIFLDATLVRSVLVPASMVLLGERNWYLPRWLAWLPDLRIEGGERGRTTAAMGIEPIAGD